MKTAVIEDFGPIDIEALAAWKNLESIRFFACKSLIGSNADAEVKFLSKLKHLKQLDLWQVDVSDDGLPSLTELRNLVRLTMYQTKVTASGLSDFNSAFLDCHVVSDALAK